MCRYIWNSTLLQYITLPDNVKISYVQFFFFLLPDLSLPGTFITRWESFQIINLLVFVKTASCFIFHPECFLVHVICKANYPCVILFVYSGTGLNPHGLCVSVPESLWFCQCGDWNLSKETQGEQRKADETNLTQMNHRKMERKRKRQEVKQTQNTRGRELQYITGNKLNLY